jgi:hypothetical protein
MLTLSGSLRVFLAIEPCDMRKSFGGLHAEVVARLGEDPRGGAVFVFTNRRRNLIKLLHFDGTGTWIHAKRLEKRSASSPPPSPCSPTASIFVMACAGPGTSEVRKSCKPATPELPC